MNTLVLRTWFLVVAASLACLYSAQTVAQTSDSESLARARAIVSSADAALTEFTKGANADAHRVILDKALAVAIFPNLRRRSLYIHSRTRGSGLVSRRTHEGWSAPAFYDLNRGTWEFGFGNSGGDLIVFFLSSDSVNQLRMKKFQLSGAAAKEMISYSHDDGFNAGGRLRGATFRPNETLTAAVSGGLDRHAILYTQLKEGLSVSEQNGTATVTDHLGVTSQAILPAGNASITIKTANKNKTYYVYLHPATVDFNIEPYANGLVEDGKITCNPPVEQWTPQLTSVPDSNSEWNIETLPESIVYHAVCIEQKEQYKELILMKDCRSDCEVTCMDVRPAQAATAAKEKPKKVAKPKRKK